MQRHNRYKCVRESRRGHMETWWAWGVTHTHTHTHTHTQRCALSKEQTLYLMSIKRWWLKSQVHSIFPRAMFISAPGRRLFSKLEMSPWAESGDSALLSVIFPAALAVLKKKMPLRKPIWAYQPYQQKMNLNSGCRWWYWDNAWWVRNIVGGKCVLLYILSLCVYVCIYTWHTHKKFEGSKQCHFCKRKRTTRHFAMWTIFKGLADPVRTLHFFTNLNPNASYLEVDTEEKIKSSHLYFYSTL